MKHTEILKSHRDAISNICIEFNLNDETTYQMHKNGTIRLYDSFADCWYSIHESGYVRRYIRPPYSWQETPQGYQLNKTFTTSITTRFGSKTCKNRILATIDEQIVLLINAIVNYRVTTLARK